MNTSKVISGVSTAINSTLAASQNGSPLFEKKQPSEFAIKVANTLEEREAVFRLAYQVYLEKGFIKKNSNEWLVQNYDAKSETMILIVKDSNKKIIASVTLVFAGNSKLPAQKIYSEEINQLTAANEKVVEISRLVINPDFRNSKDILVLLFNYLCIYSYHVKKYTCLAIEVNPRHKNYYKSLLSFKEIGDEKPCPIVENAPAVLLHLPLKEYQSEVCRCAATNNQNKKERSLYAYFIKPGQEKLVAHYLQNQFKPMRAEEKLYFGFVESGHHKAVKI